MKRDKITIVGAGNIGGATAAQIIQRNLADVVLIDVVDGLPQGKALDIAQSAPLHGSDSKIVGTNDYGHTEDSEVVIISSGFPRKRGMSRDDLLQANAGIVRAVTREIAPRSPDAIIIVVTNPLDAMTELAYRESGFRKQRVLGMGGLLDSTRFRALIAEALSVSVESVGAVVLGGHGDSMVPSTVHTTVAGVPVHDLISEERLQQLVERTRRAGSEIVGLLKTHSAYIAASAALAYTVEAILADRKVVVTVSTLCEGEYRTNGVFIGVPVKLGRSGVEQIMELPLPEAEHQALLRSAEGVRALCGGLYN